MQKVMGTFSCFHYKGPYFDNQTSLPVFSRCQMFCIILFFLPCLHVQNLHQYSFQVYIFQVYLLVSINSGTVKVRNCRLGTHADQTAEMVRN